MRIRDLALITISLLNGSLAFGSGPDLDPNPLVKRYLKLPEADCGALKTSEVGNGIETSDFKPVIQIEIQGRKGEKTFPHLCTGSLMKGGAKIFTSAHCLCLPKDETLSDSWVGDDQVREPDFILHPKAAAACKAGLPIPPEYDIAFLRVPLFAGPSKSLLVNGKVLEKLKALGSYEIGTDELKVNTEFTLVGFGQHRLGGTDPTGADVYDGKKRYGTNRIEKIDRKTQMIFSPGRTKPAKDSEKLGTGVGVLFGDSGGPLLIGGKVYGVACQLDPGLFGTESGYTAVFNPSNADFIRTTLAMPDDKL